MMAIREDCEEFQKHVEKILPPDWHVEECRPAVGQMTIIRVTIKSWRGSHNFGWAMSEIEAAKRLPLGLTGLIFNRIYDQSDIFKAEMPG